MGKQGMIIETGESKTAIWGWAAVILGVGIAVASVVLSAQIGTALLFVGGGLGVALTAVGVGEGVKRARIGDAARIEAKARMIEARHRNQLPPPN